MEMGKLACRRRDIVLLAICTISIILVLQLRNLDTQRPSFSVPIWSTSKVQEPLQEQPEPLIQNDHRIAEEVRTPANSTLGFGRIIAISTRTSHRRTSLALSADLTGLEISIPDQPSWTDTDLANFRSKKHSAISKGSAMAWLGHLNALRWFMSQPYETALMIEDDVNWDIHLRNRQIPLLARAFHDVLERESHERGFISYPELRNGTKVEHVRSLELKSKARSTSWRESYWPAAKYWEILHLGHCGDYFPSKNLSRVLHTAYPDPTMPNFAGLHIDTQHFLERMPLPSRHRLIHQSIRPLCTFAYAITKASAARILKEFSTEDVGGTVAYDVRILEACRDLGWRCWSANPELFHHLNDRASEIGEINGPKAAMPDAPRSEAQDDDEKEDKDKESDEKDKNETNKNDKDVKGKDKNEKDAKGKDKKGKDKKGKDKKGKDKPKGPSPQEIAKASAQARARGTPNIACGIRMIVERMGSSKEVRELVRTASEVDGMCPMPLEEMDLMRAQIVQHGRTDIPVDGVQQKKPAAA